MQALQTANIDFLLGLFDYDRLPYHLDVLNKTLADVPPLVSMVHYSLEMLQKPEHTNGFFLFVEGLPLAVALFVRCSRTSLQTV